MQPFFFPNATIQKRKFKRENTFDTPQYIPNLMSLRSSSSSSSCHAGSTDIPDPLSPLLPIVHRPRQVLRTTSCILT